MAFFHILNFKIYPKTGISSIPHSILILLSKIENQLTMVHAAQSGGVRFDPRTREFEFQPYFVLSLDRQYLLQQTLQKVAQASPSDLRKGLKVVFKVSN